MTTPEFAAPPNPEQDSSPEFDRSRFNIHIHYSHHDSDKDLSALRPLVKSDQFDIYVPEVPGHDEDQRFVIESLAIGDVRVYQFLKQHIEPAGDASWPFYKSIYNARKIILFPDVDAEEAKALGRDKLREGRESTGEFTKDLASYRAIVTHMANYFNARDEHVAETLPTLLQETVAAHPELHDREKIGVLMSIGVWHTGLGHRLLRSGFNVDRSFKGWPHTYDYHGEAIRSLIFRGEVDDAILERGFIEQYFKAAFDCEDHYYRGLLHRRLAAALSHDKIVEIIEANAKDPAKFFHLLETELPLNDILRSPKVKLSPAMSQYRKIKRPQQGRS